MTQITSGARGILSHPSVYSGFQRLMGARAGWRRLAQDYIQPLPGEHVLDIGCGPADLLDHLPGIRYWGYDPSPEYIARARARHGERGTFSCKVLQPDELAGLPAFDVVVASGVLHHLDDAAAQNLAALARKALRPGGRFVTVDPCRVAGQNPVARFLIGHDRGQNVRDAEGYRALVAPVFEDVRLVVRHQAWIPYTHCYMRCLKTA